ncbi:hypothetical protein Sste5346_005027 [Sporothrix stenoceras]|uniref:F-box domain-containing protein n=1 Tax=Sporothrix stenoceras TaxID=5173 RepID=A0ABR3Z5L5_9PEZI
MGRPAQSFERLPLLVLERICFYIDDEGGSEDLQRSLWAFSLTSQRCCAASAVQRFSQIHLRIRSAKTIAERVQHLIDEGLGKGERFRHVRRLRVSGGMSRREADIVRAQEQNLEGRALQPSPRAIKRAQEELKDDRDISEVNRELHMKQGKATNTQVCGHSIRHVFGDDLHPFCRPRHDRHERIVYGGSVSLDAVKVTFHSDKAWLPLADLVRQLSGLRDLVWDATSYLPPSILAAIHEMPSLCAESARNGGCRIHMHQFALHSLSQQRSHSTQSPISPDEYALVTSANLYAVVATVQSRMILDRISFTGHALVQEMLGRGRSPNLRHVWFNQVSVNTFVGLGQGEEDPDPEWQGFFPGQDSNEGKDKEKGKEKEAKRAPHSPRNRTPLTSLVFWNGVKPNILTGWLNGGNYSNLRDLTLFWDEHVIEYLADMAAGGQFAALDSFSLLGTKDGQYLLRNPSNYYGDYPDGTCYKDKYAQNDEDIVEVNLMMYLFHKLPPLRRLQYTGTLGHFTARHIYKHHGATLRNLAFTLKKPNSLRYEEMWLTKFDNDSAYELATGCPHLEELSLDMERTGGDSHEALAYRALSNETLKNLENLELRLWYRIGPKSRYVESDFMQMHAYGWVPPLDEDLLAGEGTTGGGGGDGDAINLDGDVVPIIGDAIDPDGYVDNGDGDGIVGVNLDSDNGRSSNNRRRESDWDKVNSVEAIPLPVLKKALIDCAMDEKLARSIFSELAFEPHDNGGFRYLRVEIAREAEPDDVGVGDTMFMSLLRWLGAHYVVERNANGDVVVKETDPKTTIKSGLLWQTLASQRTGDNAVQVIKDAFQALWPNKNKKNPEAWWEVWSSAPLDAEHDSCEESLETRFAHLAREKNDQKDNERGDYETDDYESYGALDMTML